MVYLHAFLTLILGRGESSFSHINHLISRKKALTDTHQRGGCVGSRACLDYLEKMQICYRPFFGYPACSLVTIMTELAQAVQINIMCPSSNKSKIRNSVFNTCNHTQCGLKNIVHSYKKGSFNVLNTLHRF